MNSTRKKVAAYLASYYQEDFVRSVVRKLRRARRFVFGVDRRLIKKYMSSMGPKKLQLGSGHNHLEGWLNSNYYPKSNLVLHVDATRRYPFPDNSFDFAYSEHMIEHVPYVAGQQMLRECYRILKPSGRLRIVTPDLVFLIQLYNKEKTELQKTYIAGSTKLFIDYAPYLADVFVINNFFRNWGHQFIYDKETLIKSFVSAGFRDVKSHSLNESEAPELSNLAHVDRYPPGFLVLESLVVEGVK